jgi:hypothetical protein
LFTNFMCVENRISASNGNPQENRGTLINYVPPVR